MPQSWKDALDKYRYSVDLSKFAATPHRPGWFELNLDPGDRCQTMDFETRFRKRAPSDLEAWAEVVYWKLYFRRGIARKRVTELLCSGVSPRALWSSCNDYIQKRDRKTFSVFRKQLFRTPVVATAATFPAFICPDAFPMVDTQIAAWLREHGCDHAYPGDVQGVPDGNIEERHWSFVESWVRWCRSIAYKLSQRTEFAWRARDVEMAVFSAQRHKPPLQLRKLA